MSSPAVAWSRILYFRGPEAADIRHIFAVRTSQSTALPDIFCSCVRVSSGRCLKSSLLVMGAVQLANWWSLLSNRSVRRNTNITALSKPEGKRPLETWSAWVDNIEINVREAEWGDMNWIDAILNWEQWGALVNTIMKFLVPYKFGKFSSTKVRLGLHTHIYWRVKTSSFGMWRHASL